MNEILIKKYFSLKKNISKIISPILEFIGFITQPLFNMMNKRFDVKCLNSDGKHVFFGYYDLSPFDKNDTKVLAHRTHHPLISPDPKSCIDIGYYDIDSLKNNTNFIKIGESNAWCWQQGSRLQWFPKKTNEKTVFYNTVKADKYIGIIQDIYTREIIKEIPLPLYDISNCGNKGLSLNFSRLQRLRPGYGYASLPDITENENIPKHDGIFLFDFKIEKNKLLISFDEIVNIGKMPEDWKDFQHYINHLCFNQSGTKFMFLHLLSKNKKRHSRLFVCNTDGSNLKLLDDSDVISHYTWKDDNTLLCTVYSKLSKAFSYTNYDLKSGKCEKLLPTVLKNDGHPTFIWNNTALLTDTYPNRFRQQSLITLDLKTKYIKKARFYRHNKFKSEVRTDLHPRVNNTETIICIDDEFDGFKAIKLLRLID
ncbi:hypothetical protein [Polaribacter porphyrae]|uniref:hypothetical protein n=1 Tax=Polaribacter porphyrae TaxID=1137780 RepID=UPI0011B02A9E|nr:hypothetical protein [Polaribacter porphyrae]